MGKLPSGAPLEALLTLGAGDGDFALVPGDPDGLAAAGTGEIAVLPVLDPVQHQQPYKSAQRHHRKCARAPRDTPLVPSA